MEETFSKSNNRIKGTGNWADDDQRFPELCRRKLRAVLPLGEEAPRHLPLLEVGLTVQVLGVDVAKAVLVRGVQDLDELKLIKLN